MTDHPKDNEINDMWDPRDDDDLMEVGRALGYDDTREPPTERVAAIRAAAAQLRDEQAHAAGGSRASHRSSNRRTLLVGVAAATVGAALGGGVVGGALGGGDEAPPTVPTVPTEALHLTGVPAGVTASGRLINHTWGTEVLLDVRDLPAGGVYRVGLETATGTTQAGSFLSVADVLMVCRFNAAPLRADVRAVVVRDARDEQVMRADLA